LWLLVLGLELAQNVHCVKSSGCKPDALWLSYILMFQAHFPVCLHCYVIKNVEEGDGWCVRASLLGSIELSKFNLLLNPPYPLQFHKSFH
jgi:hypothetical protein